MHLWPWIGAELREQDFTARCRVNSKPKLRPSVTMRHTSSSPQRQIHAECRTFVFLALDPYRPQVFLHDLIRKRQA